MDDRTVLLKRVDSLKAERAVMWNTIQRLIQHLNVANVPNVELPHCDRCMKYVFTPGLCDRCQRETFVIPLCGKRQKWLGGWVVG
jgi:hypothetical protein